ncbi:MAG: FtsQ-type POTRA domain-containing protein [Propionibacteriaceae bacterium]|nr:FtsQ-type POTRA domain-containing protein [Propionibacteriaceae bacterium]
MTRLAESRPEPLVDVTGARRRRARARLRRRLTVAGIVLGFVALVGGGAWLMGWSSVFSTDEVVTEGLVVLTHDDVVAAAQVPVGGPLARVDTDAIAERVRAMPPVADVAVSARYPHTVRIAVTERTPVIALEIGRNFVFVDDTGTAFHSSRTAPEGVLLARGSVGDETLLAAYSHVAAALPEQVRAEASAISGDTLDSIAISLRDGRRIVWGGPENSELKAQVIVPLLAMQARVYDVSAPSHPTTR